MSNPPWVVTSEGADDGNRLGTLTVPAASTLFHGHFDDNPIVPGVALLTAVSQIAGSAGPDWSAAPVHWEGVKFRAPLRPDETAEIRVEAPSDDDGRDLRRFEIHCGERLVARGAFCAPHRQPPSPSEPSRPGLRGGADLPHPLPHTGVARLVHAVLERADSSAIVTGAIDPEHGLTADGAAPSTLAIEMAAQASSFVGTGPAPKTGYLTTVKSASLYTPQLPLGRPLRCRIDLDGFVRGLRTLHFEVDNGSDVLARGTLSTYSDS